MFQPTLEKELLDQISRMPAEQQREVLAFARRLAGQRPRGVPGATYRRFAGSIAPEDLDRMKTAIEEGCERVANVSEC